MRALRALFHLLILTGLTTLTGLSLLGAEPLAPNRSWDLTLPIDGQKIDIRVRAPTNATTACPVIIFSHGLGGSREGYWPLAEAWASAGFVVIQPSHPGSDTQTLKDAGILGMGAAARKAMADPNICVGRPRLVTRIIDLIPTIQTRLEGFHGTLDATRIGVSGHSFGAWTTLAVAGVGYVLPGHGPLSDPRPLAFLALSPPGPGQVPADATAAPRPTLVMTGTEDHQPALLSPHDGIEHDWKWREQTWRLLPAGNAFLAVLANAHHSAFSAGQGARLSGDPQPEPWMGPALDAITITWWRAHLLHDATALACLENGSVVPLADRSRVRWEKR